MEDRAQGWLTHQGGTGRTSVGEARNAVLRGPGFVEVGPSLLVCRQKSPARMAGQSREASRSTAVDLLDLRLSHVLGGSAESWMAMQVRHSLAEASRTFDPTGLKQVAVLLRRRSSSLSPYLASSRFSYAFLAGTSTFALNTVVFFTHADRPSRRSWRGGFV